MTAATAILEPIDLVSNSNGDESIAGKTLAEFSARQAAIVTMRERFTGLTCATARDYETTRLAIAELRTFRREIKERKKLLNEDAYAWIKSVNSESARLIEEAEAIETPLQEMKDAVDAEKERKRVELATAQAKRLEDAARVKVEADAAKLKAEQDAIAEKNRVENERLAAERAKLAAENARLAAEREKIEAERQAAQWRLELAQREEAAKQQAARDELARQQREFREKVEAAERAEREKKEAAERAEIKRQAEIRAEREKAEREEREAKEAAANAARREAMKPDIEKVYEFGDRVLKLREDIPDVQSCEAKALMTATREWLGRIAGKLAEFGV